MAASIVVDTSIWAPRSLPASVLRSPPSDSSSALSRHFDTGPAFHVAPPPLGGHREGHRTRLRRPRPLTQLFSNLPPAPPSQLQSHHRSICFPEQQGSSVLFLRFSPGASRASATHTFDFHIPCRLSAIPSRQPAPSAFHTFLHFAWVQRTPSVRTSASNRHASYHYHLLPLIRETHSHPIPQSPLLSDMGRPLQIDPGIFYEDETNSR